MAPTRIKKLVTVAAVGIAVAGALAAASPGTASAATASIFRVDTSPQPANSRLEATSAVSATDVWAVGTMMRAANVIETLAEHFNGSTWSVVPTPQPSAGGGFFTAVSAASSTDVWAIGTFGGQPFTEHWNGNKWSIVPITDPTTTNNNVVFTGVKAISPTNVYTVGAYQALTFPYDPMQFIEHWNGRSWKVLPNPFDAVIPSAIDASSASDIWIVGNQRSGAFTEHFNGTSWSVVPSASPNGPSAVVALSPTNAWGVSSIDTQHWDGRTWKLVTDGAGVEGFAITALSADDIWAVGIDDRRGVARIKHWNGRAWSVVALPNAGGNDFTLLDVSSAPNGHVYAVGNSFSCTPTLCTSVGLILETDQG